MRCAFSFRGFLKAVQAERQTGQSTIARPLFKRGLRGPFHCFQARHGLRGRALFFQASKLCAASFKAAGVARLPIRRPAHAPFLKKSRVGVLNSSN